MPTKQSMISEQPKEATESSRKKYKEAKKARKTKTPSKKESRTKDVKIPVLKKKISSNPKRRSKTTEKSNTSPTVEGKENRTRKEQKKLQKAEKRANKRPVRRIFPIWLRLIVIPLLCIAALLLGLMIGYGVIGDGSPKDALKMETWQHIIDIVSKK